MNDENPDLDHVFASRIARQREHLNLSKTDLARRMNDLGWDSYSQMTVTRTENEDRKVGVAEAHALAEALHQSYDELVRYGREQELANRIRKFRLERMQLAGALGSAIRTQNEFARQLDDEGGEIPRRIQQKVDEVLSWNAVEFVHHELIAILEQLDTEEWQYGESGERAGAVKELLERQSLGLYDVLSRKARADDDGVDQEA